MTLDFYIFRDIIYLKSFSGGKYMQSFGVWCKMTEEGGKEPSIEKLQINLWDLEKCKSDQGPFIDFGLQIDNIDKLQSIKIYIPFALEENDIKDLSERIADAETARLLFNDNNYDSATSGNFNYLSYQDEKDGKKINKTMLIIPFESKNLGKKYIEIESITNDLEESNGTILKLFIDQIASDLHGKFDEAYIRFRIVSPKIYNSLFCKIKKKNLFLESGFTALKVVDLKINKKRNIPQSICHNLEQASFTFAKFSMIHFFIMEKAQNDVIPLSSQVFTDCRMLEEGAWDTYLSMEMTPQRFVVYHSKVKEKCDYSFVAKILESTTNWKIIWAYIGIVILLGLVSSFLYTIFGWLGENFPNFIMNLQDVLFSIHK